MKKYLHLVLFVVLMTGTFTYGQIVFTEDFNYTVNSLLTANGYTASSGAGTNSITVISPGLSLTNYFSTSTSAVTLTTNGEDDYKAFTAQSSGSVYLSFLVNVSAALTGDYFIAISPATQYNYTGRIYVKTDGASGFFFGISKSSEEATYGTTSYTFGTTYLVVMKYTFNTTSTTDDAISLFVLSSLTSSTTEPSTPTIGPYVCSDATKTDATTQEYVTLRQGSATKAPSLTVDGIKVSTAWTSGVVVSVQKETSSIPTDYVLNQNYPNPFNPSTKISFSVPASGYYMLKVYDMLGQEVSTLISEELSAGKYSVNFNAGKLASGTYVYRLTGNNITLSQKMLLVK